MKVSRRFMLILSLIAAVIFAGFYRQYTADIGELIGILGITLSIGGALYAISKADDVPK